MRILCILLGLLIMLLRNHCNRHGTLLKRWRRARLRMIFLYRLLIVSLVVCLMRWKVRRCYVTLILGICRTRRFSRILVNRCSRVDLLFRDRRSLLLMVRIFRMEWIMIICSCNVCGVRVILLMRWLLYRTLIALLNLFGTMIWRRCLMILILSDGQLYRLVSR